VRELEHLIARSALKALGRQPERPRILTLIAADIDLEAPALLMPDTDGGQTELDLPQGSTLREAMTAYERRLISTSLLHHGGNVAATARELGIDRANLNRLTRRLGLK
jgi:anaerobic nitric oxide reductase transcription regulator